MDFGDDGAPRFYAPTRSWWLQQPLRRAFCARTRPRFELCVRRCAADDEAFLAAALEAERLALGGAPPAPHAPAAPQTRGGAAPPPAAHASPSSRAPSRWVCLVCGGGNALESEKCSICTSLRPERVRPPAPALAQAAQRGAAEQTALRAFFAPAPPPRVEPAEAPPVDAEGLAECPGATAGLRIDPVAALTYVYPSQREQRAYQLAITRRALFTNTLVCLPTGLGKTLVAAVLMYNYYRWFPKGKVVFLAPTRPLVQQQAEACRSSLGIPRRDMCELTGSSRKGEDGRRGGLWAAHRVFFATPQTFANDLRDGVCPAAAVVALVLDEAHRATGNYAYVAAVKHLTDAGVRFRLLALSATPGTTADAVQAVLRNLHIGAVEYRSEEDADVAPYTFRRQVDLRVVQPTSTMRDLEEAYTAAFRPMVEELGRVGVIHNAYDVAALLVSPYAFTSARKALQANESLQAQLGPRIGRVHWLLTSCGLLARGLQQLQSEGVKAALDYILMRKDDFDKLKSPALEQVVRDLQSAAAGGESHAPKLAELIKVLREHFTDAAAGAGPGAAGDAAGASTRAIVFTSARESVRHIMEELQQLRSCGVAASEFVGQGDSNARGSGRERKKGQTQAEQTAILSRFRKGTINVIVATCIGEEGLDVPQVDLVVFMDAVGIIRLVQRMGRTGCVALALFSLSPAYLRVCVCSQPSARRPRGGAGCCRQGGAQLEQQDRRVRASAAVLVASADFATNRAGRRAWQRSCARPTCTSSCAARARAWCRTGTRRRSSCATSSLRVMTMTSRCRCRPRPEQRPRSLARSLLLAARARSARRFTCRTLKMTARKRTTTRMPGPRPRRAARQPSRRSRRCRRV